MEVINEVVSHARALTPEEKLQRRREAQKRYYLKKKAAALPKDPRPLLDEEERKRRRREVQKRYIQKKYPERQPRRILTLEERIENKKVIQQRYYLKKKALQEAMKRVAMTPAEAAQRKRDQARESYLKRKAEVQSHRQEKHVCPLCFGTYTNNHKATHAKTARHVRALEAQTPNSEES
jgi:hypothetical protein